MDDFTQITLLVALAAVLGIVARALRQPLIMAYIVCGIIAGPFALNFISSTGSLSLFSHIGISLLLFIVGLGLSPHVIREVGKASVITGVGQIIFTSLFGFLLCLFLGFQFIEALYLSIAITFSSTIIIMKILTDRGDTETLYGKISIGFLIVQDVVAIFILMIISSLHSGGGVQELITNSAINGGLLLASIYLISRYILPKISGSIAKSQENLVAFSVGWCLLCALAFGYFGFSMEIGALLAGVAMAGSLYRFEIMARMRALRDFFLILFFILLGSQMQFGDVSSNLLPIAVISIFILVGNPLIVFFIMTALGHTARNGFMAGLTVAQISEFSIILIALGIRIGHLGEEFLSLITLIGIITISGSVYMILYSDKLYHLLSGFLEKFQKKHHPTYLAHKNKNISIILFGHNRIGYELVENFIKRKSSFLVVDHNPQIVEELAKKNVSYAYGDASDMGFLEDLPIKNSKLIISTIPDYETNAILLTQIRKLNKKAIVFSISHDMKEALELYSLGADYVVMPHFLSGKHLNYLLKRFYGGSLKKQAKKHTRHIIKELKKPHWNKRN